MSIKAEVIGLAVSLAAISVGGAVMANKPATNAFDLKASGADKTIIINDSSAFSFGTNTERIYTENVKTLEGNDVKFMGIGFQVSAGFGQLKQDSNDGRDYFLTNIDPIFGLTSITVTYSSSSPSARLYVEYCNNSAPGVQSNALTSNVTYSFLSVDRQVPNIFKIYAYGGDVDIDTITVNYTCAGASGYFPRYITPTIDGDEVSITNHVYYYSGRWAFMIPGYYNELPITSIASNLFKNDYCINMISFPNNGMFTTIPEGACTGCIRLAYAVIPASVTAIGAAAFKDCYALKTIFFEGNETQWNSISKAADWNQNVESCNVVFEA